MPGLESHFCEKSERAGISASAGLRPPTAATYWRTLRHLRWSQLGYLALKRVLVGSKSPAKMRSQVGLCDVPGRWRFLEWRPEASRQMLSTREFTFLNQTVPSNGSIPWNDRRYDKLWLYHLNYFDYLNVGFRLPADKALLDAAGDIALDWCRQNTQGKGVGWEPYPLSLRIVNWLKFLARHKDALVQLSAEARQRRLLDSLGVQVTTLERRLEKDLLGNHFLKNIKALLFAGAWLESTRSSHWWAQGAALLEQQLHEQILPDGGHVERSPMYHSQVLEDLAEIRLLCASTGRSLPCSDLLSKKIASMAHFLKGIVHPDGEIPHFNDSVLGGARPPHALLAMSGFGLRDAEVTENTPYVRVFPDTGYGVIRSPESRSALIFDCGPLGPDYQPGHGHCDVLSYELSLQGQRVAVNTGVSTYEPGPVRSYERSTAAHNTVRIDDEEQAETWASFRVGRRPRVGPVRGGCEGVLPFVTGEHDAYRRLGVVHARTILLRAPDTWIVADLFRGSGCHRIELNLHFHPRVRVEGLTGMTETNADMTLRRWTLNFAGETYGLVTYGGGRFDLRESWYSAQFGKRQPAMMLRGRWEGTIPAGMIHIFTPADIPAPPIVANWAGEWIEIGGQRIALRLRSEIAE
jgi:uncharacterized heparinase superfamily protein